MDAKIKKAIKVLYEQAEQTLDREGYSPGDWPELEKAMRTLGPLVYSNWKGISAFGEKS